MPAWFRSLFQPAATWAKGANLGPCIRVLKEARPVLVVVADSARVRIHRYVDRTISFVESFDREVQIDQAYHMSRPAPQGFSSGTRGTPGADAAQREMRKGTETMLAEAAREDRGTRRPGCVGAGWRHSGGSICACTAGSITG